MRQYQLSIKSVPLLWKLTPTLLLLLGGIACSSSDSDAQISFPTVDIECTSSVASDCTSISQGKPARVGLLLSLTADCEDAITVAGSSFSSAFVASSEIAAEYNGIEVWGLFGEDADWVNEDGQNLSSIAPGSYTLCAHIDTDEDGLLDSGEPFSEGVVSVNAANILIDDWRDL